MNQKSQLSSVQPKFTASEKFEKDLKANLAVAQRSSLSL